MKDIFGCQAARQLKASTRLKLKARLTSLSVPPRPATPSSPPARLHQSSTRTPAQLPHPPPTFLLPSACPPPQVFPPALSLSPPSQSPPVCQLSSTPPSLLQVLPPAPRALELLPVQLVPPASSPHQQAPAARSHTPPVPHLVSKPPSAWEPLLLLPLSSFKFKSFAFEPPLLGRLWLLRKGKGKPSFRRAFGTICARDTLHVISKFWAGARSGCCDGLVGVKIHRLLCT